jgi:hypothetical protein
MKKAAGAVDGGVKDIVGKLKSLAGPVIAAFGFGKLFGDYISQADELGDFSASVGESIQTVDSWIQAVTKAGGSGEAFKGSVSSMTKSLAQAATQGTGRAKKALDELGVSVTDAEGKTRKASDVFMELAGIGETMDQTTFRGLLTQLGIDEGTLRLIQQGKAAVAEAIDAGRALAYTEEDARVAGEFDDAWQDARKALSAVSAEIMREVTPALKWLADKVKGVAAYLKEHPQYLKGIVIGIGAVAAAINAKMIPAFLKLGLSLLTNPITWLALLFILIALAIEDLIVWANGGESALGRLWEAIFGSPEEAKAIWESVKAKVKEFWEAVKEWDVLSKAWDMIRAWGYALETFFVEFGGFIGYIMGVIHTFFENAWGRVSVLTSNLAEAIKSFFLNAFEKIKGFVETFIINPIRKAMDLFRAARGALTGDAGEAVSGEQRRDLDELIEANRERRRSQEFDPARGGWVPRGAAGAAAALPPGGGGSTFNDNRDINLGPITVNTDATDPAGTAAAFNQDMGDVLARHSQRPMR